MLLSQTTTYAVRAAIHLAERGGTGPVPVAEIADSLDVPRNYLGKILHQLAREGLLASERGPRGGFRLAASPAEVSLVAIARAVDPRLGNRRCLLGRESCTDADPCPAHAHWQGLADRITKFLRETTVADLQHGRGRPGGKRSRARKAVARVRR